MQKMKAMRGNASNLVAFSNLIFKVSKFSEPHQFNGYGSLHLLRTRLFSSIDAHNRNEEGIKNGRNVSDVVVFVDDDDDSKFSGGNRGDFGNEGFDSGDDSDFVDDDCKFSEDEVVNRDYRSRGIRNDEFSQPISEREYYYEPSVRDLLNCPFPDENSGWRNDDWSKAETWTYEENYSTPPDAPQDADEIFNNMKKSGLIPNAVAMIDGLCNDGLIHEAMKIFGMMREKGTMPEVVVYTSVIEGLCQAQKIDDAVRVFKKMKDNGIVPNAFSYTVLIIGLCNATRLEEGIYLCFEMVEAGHSPNVFLFTGLVQEICREKGLEDAKWFIRTLREKGFFLDERAIRIYYDRTGPTTPMVWEAIFGPKKTFNPKATT